MKAVPALFQHPSRTRTVLAAFALIVTLLSSGCYGPAKGPTDPKDFIVHGKQWTNSSAAAAPAVDPSATPAPAP